MQLKNERFDQVINIALEQILATILPNLMNVSSLCFLQKEPAMVYSEWMAGIMLAGPPLRSIIKLHFNHPTLKRWSFSKEDSKIDDQMKEVCNVLSGTFKSYLEQADLQVGISIPFLASGMDEALFVDNRKEGSVFYACNILSGNEDLMTFSHELEIMDKKTISKLNKLPEIVLATQTESNSDDGMEML
jgi:hypothetical protein